MTTSRVHSRFSTDGTNAQTIIESAPQHMYPPPLHSRGATSSSLGSTWLGSRLGMERHPFQLAIEKQQSLSERNLPYLRHSWNRIDFLAVLSFWIMFGLAISGVENVPHRHLYIFRALSVLRVSRLLAVTSGTTVSDYNHSKFQFSLTILVQRRSCDP